MADKAWDIHVNQILERHIPDKEIACSFRRTASQLQSFLSLRLLQLWSSTGFSILTKSKKTAIDYFSHVPESLDSLYHLEIKLIFEITSLTGRKHPEEAIEFYKKMPARLLKLNPNIRDTLLGIVKKNSIKNPEGTNAFFIKLIDIFSSFSFPLQESVIENETCIARLSEEASLAYLFSVKKFLGSINEYFLPLWVRKGLSLLKHDKQNGIDYFSLKTDDSKNDAQQWKEAIFFDDKKNILSTYVKALCGKKIQLHVKGTKNENNNEKLKIYLPPYIAHEKKARDNFILYKIAAAHQSGYIEFNTFDLNFSFIRKSLDSLPLKGLGWDIFFILEDGRINFKLKKEYAGLKKDLEKVSKKTMTRRVYPTGDLLKEALEILLYFTMGHMPKNNISSMLAEYAKSLKLDLKHFYDDSTNVLNVFSKAMELYKIIAHFSEDLPYKPIDHLPFREPPDLENMPGGDLKDNIPDNITPGDPDFMKSSEPLSKQEIEELMKLLKDLDLENGIKGGTGDEGLCVNDLDGIVVQAVEDNEQMGTMESDKVSAPPAMVTANTKAGPFFYDEWDFQQKSYRKKWCSLMEKEVPSKGAWLFDRIYKNNENLIKKVKTQFQRIRPEVMENVKRLEWGDEIDFNAMLESVVDRKAGDTPSDRVFERREKKTRRISTLLLVDMSASTDRLASSLNNSKPSKEPDTTSDSGNSALMQKKNQKIIDIEIESLVVMTEALEALDDEYAIYGFSGYGREQVDFYCIKEFEDRYSEDLKGKIGSIKAQKSTRIGPALRHATSKLRAMDSDHRLLIILSDGYPQDVDYGEDRSSSDYALQDTMMALIEARRADIKPFCITVDQCGDDYLKKISDPKSYLVIKDIFSLPNVLPKVVESLIG